MLLVVPVTGDSCRIVRMGQLYRWGFLGEGSLTLSNWRSIDPKMAEDVLETIHPGPPAIVVQKGYPINWASILSSTVHHSTLFSTDSFEKRKLYLALSLSNGFLMLHLDVLMILFTKFAGQPVRYACSLFIHLFMTIDVLLELQ